MAVRTKIQETAERLQPLFVLLICCLLSLLIATNVRCHSSLTLYLYDEMPSYGMRQEFHWLGATHGLIVYMFLPFWCGIIDNFKLSYRVCVVVSCFMQLAGCFLSTALADPGYLILTDSIMSGCGASIMLATVILVTDDNFPDNSRLRILATTLVQGSAFATFFLVDFYSGLLHRLGWRRVLQIYSGVTFGLGILGLAVFARPKQSYQPLPMPNTTNSKKKKKKEEEEQREEEEETEEEEKEIRDASVIDRLQDSSRWQTRLLSLSQSEFASSRTTILFLLERLFAAFVSDGLFLFLLMRSGIAHHPYSTGGATYDKKGAAVVAFMFTIGSTCSYLSGGCFGLLIKGKLLAAYMLGALINICSIIAWITIINDHYKGELVIGWLCGFGVGVISTFAYASSEEATGVRSRSIFPLTRLTSGMSVCFIEFAYTVLNSIDGNPIEMLLLVVLLFSMGEFGLLVLIRARLNETNQSIRPRKMRQ